MCECVCIWCVKCSKWKLLTSNSKSHPHHFLLCFTRVPFQNNNNNSINHKTIIEWIECTADNRFLFLAVCILYCAEQCCAVLIWLCGYACILCVNVLKIYNNCNVELVWWLRSIHIHHHHTAMIWPKSLYLIVRNREPNSVMILEDWTILMYFKMGWCYRKNRMSESTIAPVWFSIMECLLIRIIWCKGDYSFHLTLLMKRDHFSVSSNLLAILVSTIWHYKHWYTRKCDWYAWTLVDICQFQCE